MYDVGAGKPTFRAIDVVRWLLPPIGALFYFSSVIFWALRHGQEDTRRDPARAVVSWLTLAIFLTYLFEPSVLSYLTFPDQMIPLLDDIILSLTSAFSWFLLLLEFNKPYGRQTLYHPIGGCSVIYLVGETLLLVLGSHPTARLAIPSATRIFRLGILLILVGIVAISHAAPIKCRSSDEEQVPLLRDDNNRTQGNNTYPCYGSTARDQVPDSREDNQSGPEHFRRRITFLAPFFWPMNRPCLRYFGIWLCLVIDRAMIVLVPLQFAKITDILIRNHGVFTTGDIATSIVICVLGFSGLSSVAQRYLWLSIENHSYLKLSTVAFNKVMTLACELEGNRNSASLWELVSRALSARHAFQSILFQIIPTAVDLLLGAGVLCYIFGAYMALLLVTVVLMSLWSSGEFLHKLQNEKRRLIAAMDKEHFVLCESTSNWQTASYSNRIPYEKIRHFSAVMQHMNSSSEFFLWSCLGSVVQSVPVTSGLIMGSTLASFQVIRGEISTGGFVMFLMYWIRLGLQLQLLARGIHDAILGLANIDELLTLFNMLPSVSNHAVATPLLFERGVVEFNNVHFAYRGQKKVLKGVSFQAPAAQTVALVGATGSGKSTILSLLLRLRDPLQGNITIDGQDIRHITLESLRANVGIVSQDPVLFHDTIMNNIIYGNSSATEEQVYDACKAVDLHDKFESLGGGYQTIVGDGGMRLSGGELQRVAIARAMIKNSKIILLDEVTSSVDSSTEALIQRNLRKLCKGRTTFIIAHRLSTVAKADKIIVLRHGRVVEQGSHGSLLRANGYYCRLWSRQIKTKPSVTMIEDASLLQQQSVAEQTTKGKSRSQDTDDLIEIDDSRSVTGIGPIIKVSKVRRTGDFKEMVLGNKLGEGDPADTSNVRPKRSTLKPDAPEFIPSSQRADFTEHQNLSKQDIVNEPQDRSENHLMEPQNIPGMTNTVIGNESAAEYPAKKRKRHSKRISSILRQTNNGVVLAYPKKARRRKGSKGRPVLRRERTESEPISMMMSGLYQQQQ